MSENYKPPFTMTDVIDGKTVLGPPQDIREVKNAYEAYERVPAHRQIMYLS
jgi:hypothetical protein